MPYFSKRRQFRATSTVALDPPPRTAAAHGAPSGVDEVPVADWPAADDPIWQGIVGMDRVEVETLAGELDGFLSFPGLADYQTARAAQHEEWPTPSLIAYCRTELDVAICLRFAEAKGMLISIRSGGHNRGGYHLCNGLVIDVSCMHAIEIDDQAKQVTVQAGANFEHLDAALEPHDFVVPGGTCANVCVAGYYLGGGYSLASRTFGMGCDSVITVRVMAPDGTIKEVSRDNELYWGLLGGSGGQFGVVLGYTVQGHEPDSFWGFLAQWPVDKAPEVFEKLRTDHMASQVTAQPFGYYAALTVLPSTTDPRGHTDPQCIILGMYHGTEAKGRKELAEVLGVGKVDFGYSKQASYSTINTELFELLPYKLVEKAKEEGFTGLVSVGKPIDWTALVDAINDAPFPGNLIMLEPYGGAVKANDDGRNAYPHRGEDFDLMIDSFWDGDEVTQPQAIAWMHDLVDKVEPALSGRVYVNYAERNLADYRHQYWAQNYDRLAKLKIAEDPENVFRFDQSVQWVAPVPWRTSPAPSEG